MGIERANGSNFSDFSGRAWLRALPVAAAAGKTPAAQPPRTIRARQPLRTIPADGRGVPRIALVASTSVRIECFAKAFGNNALAPAALTAAGEFPRWIVICKRQGA